ncbi:MDR family MFS transporter [Mesonia sp. MT50]|uniref:MDR family MFS transporter n=1 Tax=Mesonia profundi TaxID=3070998 RepID=A0ABU0ZX86_9FLAO|nr:MDR family MFS transporter [Mesonia profundi]MDQ7916084.1 MDR family MFS transporter [Mesonia profundi]
MNNSPLPLKRNWILAALMLTMFLAAMDIAIVSTVIPQIVGDLGGFKKFSWVFSIYLLTQTASIPVYGKMADMYGRKKILLIGIVIFLVGSAACGASWNIESLIAFRGLQGLGAGSIMAIVNTIAGDIYTVKERSKIQGWLSSIWGISAIIGPALGGAMVEYVNWRWIFLINIPIGLVSVVLLMMFLKEKVSVIKTKIDYLGAFLIFTTLTLLITFLLNGGQAWAWLSFYSLGLFGLVAALLCLCVYVERRAESPIMPLWLWTHRPFLGSILALMGMGVIIMGPETYLPTFTQASLGIGVTVSGLILASMSIGWPTASALSGKLYLRIGFRNTAIIGAVLVFLAAISFLLIPYPQPVYLLVINQVILGAGFGLISTPVLVGVQSMVDWNQRGVVTGATMFGRNLGQSLGAAIVGAIFNASFSQQVSEAPFDLPEQDGNILQMLQTPSLSAEAKFFLKGAINTANHHIYYGMAILAVLTFAAIWLIPKKIQTKEESN